MQALGEVLTCKAAVAYGPGQPLKIETVQVAPPKSNEVRIKIDYTALCHTDFVFWKGQGLDGRFPRIFGHEAAGTVESVGEGVTNLKVGDAVLPVFTGECGECPHCKHPKSNMCDLLRIDIDRTGMLSDKKSRFSVNGKPINHFLGTSTFSQYTVCHVGCLAKINPKAPRNKVCILSCGVSTGMGAMVNCAKPTKGSVVAVFGLGGVGLAAAEGARINGAARIIGIDINSDRFEKAKEFGCTEFLNPRDYDRPIEEVVKEMTNGGVDAAVECTGIIQAMMQAFNCVHDGWGVAVLVGVPRANDMFQAAPTAFLDERTLTGTFFGNYKPLKDLPQLVDLFMNKKLELEKFITHRTTLSNINYAFELMKKGEGIRCVIDMNA